MPNLTYHVVFQMHFITYKIINSANTVTLILMFYISRYIPGIAFLLIDNFMGCNINMNNMKLNFNLCNLWICVAALFILVNLLEHRDTFY